MTDLSLVPLDDLCNEILKRCDSGLIVTRKIRAQQIGFETRRQWKGDVHVVLGLAADISGQLVGQAHAGMQLNIKGR